jgi:hypothetical protein
MTMKKAIAIFCAALVCISAFAGERKQNLKVLYVGGTSDIENVRNVTPEMIVHRMLSWQNYLKGYFTQVDTVRGSRYVMDMSAKYDVTIFDAPTKELGPAKVTYDEKGGVKDYFQARRLDESFSYPAIFIADAGESEGRAIGTKTDWYCLCLDADAHHFNASHPIFNGPFKVTMTIREKPTPEDAKHYEYYTGALPDSLPMWRVQTKGCIDDNTLRIGMVARPWGFTDSPDAEVISSGVCQKTADAVAIGRHGNFFFWGFAGSPDYFTDEAKQVFANVVVYTAGLKGKKIIARKYFDRSATKEYVKELEYYTTQEAYEFTKELERQFAVETAAARRAAEAKRARGDSLDDDEKFYVDADTVYVDPTFDDFLKDNMREYYEQFSGDPKAFCKWLDDNYPYLYGGGMFYYFDVDEDAKALGIANTDIRLIDTAITMLERKEDVARAQRILDRYTLCTFESPAEWRSWFNANRDRMFFTQSGGWYWLVNSTDPSVQGNDYEAKGLYLAARSIETAKVSDADPVSVGASCAILPGGKEYVVVKMTIKPGYHIYGRVSSKDPYIPAKVALTLPEGASQGAVRKPSGKIMHSSGTVIYENQAIYVFPVVSGNPVDATVKCTYQCCDSHVCLPPTDKEVKVSIR